jgi:DDE superfamily endonuclease
MNLNTLSEFRQQVYACLESRADALFSLCDGLLSQAQARSLPQLSLSPYLERKWPSAYAALADGKINIEQLCALCIRYLLAELPADSRIWIAVDSSPVQRPAAATSEERGSVHVSNLPLADKAVSVGWSFPVVALLPETASSWTPILEVQRIESTQTAVGVAIEQLRQLKPLLADREVIVLANRCYGSPQMLRACPDLGYSVLIRLKSNRKLYRAPVRTPTRGAPPKDGPLLQGSRPETQQNPAAVWEGLDQAGKPLRVSR